MFTGIIEATARVLEKTDQGVVLARPVFFDDLKLGSSISVSGVCLTVTAMDEKSFSFDVVPESFARSTLGTLQPGDTVNLERAMPATGRFDGHVVQGHVEGVGEIVVIKEQGNSSVFSLGLPKDLLRFVVEKGSITLDGISLTVASVESDVCTVAVIPETMKRTTFGLKKAGDRVNVETDMLVRAVLQKK